MTRTLPSVGIAGYLADIAAELPASAILTDPDVTAAYARDQSRLTDSEPPAAVLIPRSTAEVSRCLAAASRHGVTVIPRGAGSGLSGAVNATVDAVVLSLHRMADIVEIDTANRVAVVQPGVITADLRSAAAAAGLFYPPDPGSVEFCTIGGNIATNAGGMCCVRYGVTGDFVLGLEVVLADGRVLRTGRRTRKGVAGYDLTRLFVGSEGTLGVVTEVTVQLVPAPRPPHTLVSTFSELTAAGRAVTDIVAAGVIPDMLEILDRTTVRAVDSLAHMDFGGDVAAVLLTQCEPGDVDRVAAICESAGAVDTAATEDAAEGAMMLEARRLALPALERLGDWLLDDVCVPVTAVADLIAEIEQISDRLGLTIGVFGHAGDGNLHPTVIFDDSDPGSRRSAQAAFDAITESALRLGGTITGEHGVGRLKQGWLHREQGSVGMDVQRTLKAALDPQNLLCPGGMLG
ncbi:FAD-linked oxidase C-terminal domain-containing protein [Mycobacterium sp. AMU20-3851]|uniref:FAD-binding oxidoreductase n=1 Tax=Mycobacterium sp. AMU20-3851 TaxID=3122055 RepID=UPI003753FC86